MATLYPLADVIDDLVEYWHQELGKPYGVFVQLQVYLGMSDDQYGRWLRRADDVDDYVADRIRRQWDADCGPPVTVAGDGCCPPPRPVQGGEYQAYGLGAS